MSGNRYFSEAYSKLTFQRVEFDDEVQGQEELTTEEVSLLASKAEALGLDYYGVKVNKADGIFFDFTKEGSLYGAAGDLMELFDTVADTVLFSGIVEIRAADIDEYIRFEITDSVVTAEKVAQLNWV